MVIDESKCVGCGLCVRDCPGFGLVLERTTELRKQLEDDDVPEWERIWQEGHPRKA